MVMPKVAQDCASQEEIGARRYAGKMQLAIFKPFMYPIHTLALPLDNGAVAELVGSQAGRKEPIL